MEGPKSLNDLFTEKIFRIPDYQRGYAWVHGQLKDFWEDLVNLSNSRSHYTGVLTLKFTDKISETANEYWLVEDHSYKVYDIVDGQQRLTTFVIFLQAFMDLYKSLPEFAGKRIDEIFISESLSIAEMQNKFLFKTKPNGDRFRTYKFGYTADNPSYEYLRYRIFGEPGAGSIQETFYTLNLSNAKNYFTEQLRDLHQHEGLTGLQNVYKKLTKCFLFNEYIIRDEFDVFVAFETMNNRGKKLSDLELLKNRLIYLTTLYGDDELDKASRDNLRTTINNAWREVYYQLGRNKDRPLKDDDFLQAHWTMYFKYSRKTGKDYIRFLLEEQFTPQRVHKKVERHVQLEDVEEQSSSYDLEGLEDENGEAAEEEELTVVSTEHLRPTEIRDFVNSLRESAVHWYNTWNPMTADGLTDEERLWIDRINRVGMAYFRPLMMAVLKAKVTPQERIEVFQAIERFIFIAFRMSGWRANYGSSEFYNAARAFDREELDGKEIVRRLNKRLLDTIDENGILNSTYFHSMLAKLFANGSGYYGWSGLRYFLYEYELSLLDASRQKKVDWSDLLKTPKDKISIEHIYPQIESEDWSTAFDAIPEDQRKAYSGSLGNLLLLSMSINSSLQNESFAAKKHAQFDPQNRKIRNGYEDGSHSEIEVAQRTSWGPSEIRVRGLKLLEFMEKRWNFKFANDEERERLLFLKAGE
ncbi:MAG: DUF262 domain-containing protein [Acidobacterium ailaaui]|nr:DUF262 domain-containing protein [Pseudacidobacterium ailaaui]